MKSKIQSLSRLFGKFKSLKIIKMSNLKITGLNVFTLLGLNSLMAQDTSKQRTRLVRF